MHHASTAPAPADVPRLRRLSAREPVTLVWLGDAGRSRYHHTPEAPAERFDLVEVARPSAGSVHLVRCGSDFVRAG